MCGSSWGSGHPAGRIRKAWTGIKGYSADGFPLIGRVPCQKGLFIAASFQGSCMVMCFLCAKALVATIRKRTSTTCMNGSQEHSIWVKLGCSTRFKEDFMQQSQLILRSRAKSDCCYGLSKELFTLLLASI